jgi:hypothetical protein
MTEQYHTGLDVVGGVEDKMATEELLAVYRAFPHFVKADELSIQVDEYHDQLIELTDKIDEKLVCPVLRFRRWRLKGIIDATFQDAEEAYTIGNSFLPPSRPIA